MSFKLRQAKVGLLIFEGQGMVEQKCFVTRFCRQKVASHRVLGPPPALDLIEIVFPVKDELLEMSLKVFCAWHQAVAR